MKDTNISLNDHVLYNLNNNWYYTFMDAPAPLSTTLPTHLSTPQDISSVTLKRCIKEASPSANYLLLRSSQQCLEVFIDAQLIYSYDIASITKFEDHTASAWHFIKLPYNYDFNTSHTLSIKLSSTIPSNVGVVNDVYLGSQIACLYMLFRTYGFAWLTCLLLFLLGLVLLSYSILSLFKSHRHTPLFYLGTFATCAALWSASESRLLQFIISNRQFEYYLNYCLLFLLPIPFLFYIKISYATHKALFYDILIWLFGLNFMCCIALVIFNVMNFTEIDLIFKLLLVFTLILCSKTFFSSIKILKYNKFFTLLGFIALLSTATLDLIRACMGFVIDSSFCFRIGLIIFVFTTSFDFEQHLLKSALERSKAKTLETLAYCDTMTGLFNRTAFNEKLDHLEQTLSSHHSLAILLLDINNLKITNDTLGHIVGDLLITHTARLLKQIYGDIAPIYRIGGDEFVIIFENLPENILNLYLQKFQHELVLHNTMQSPTLSIASGYAYYQPALHHTIHDVFIVADENMYDCKQTYKSKSIHK